MANHKFKILAFDPGLTNTGWSFSEVDIKDDSLTILKIGEFHPGPTVEKKSYRDQVEQFDKRTITLAYLREQLTKLLLELKPNAVCAEDIFMNVRRPMAYGALAMHQCITRLVCRDVANKRLITIPTKIAKAALTHSGSSDKLTVQQHVASNDKIHFKNPEDLQHITEHEADSIAVAFALVKMYKDFILAEMEKTQ